MQATKTLPEQYKEYAAIHLAKNKRLLILLSVSSLLLFFGFGWLFVQIALLLRPDAAPLMKVVEVSGAGGIFFSLPLSWIWGALLAFFLTPLLHEAAHGVCFWLFTHDRPRFAYKVLYAYAAAPAWYMPRGPYLVVGLAPLALLSLAGVGLLPVVSQAFIPLLVALLTLNAAGAVGDIAMIGWLLFQPKNVLARDTGDAVTLYRLLPEREALQAGNPLSGFGQEGVDAL